MTRTGLSDAQRRVLVWSGIGAAAVFVLTLAIAGGLRTVARIGRIGQPQAATLTQDVVVERLREVAKLVATEMTLRDVVTYRQTRYGSTKQTLLVVTGRVAAGIDLERGTSVRIDSAHKRITVTLPPAEVLSVDVVNIRTYDERAGLLNPFRPADRDAIQRRIRTQLVVAARQSGILEHADRSAANVLHELLGRDGYTVEIRRPIALQRPTG